MGKFDSQKFATNTNEWATPNSLFEPLHQEFNFTCDVAASHENAKCPIFFDKQTNALTQHWSGTCWMNPPYGENLKKFIIKAFEEAQKGNATTVCLIPARTNTDWFHQYCLKGEIRFIKGRPKFNNAKHGLPQPLAIVVFRKREWH